ncbi:gamma-glutamylcyclotransferase [Roseibium salinum]|uniref:glutathione-specific gamma-glutamylcyclotransferase n=1 Tax=Roseibium salinum TaxID=1604349 RepID=A0ABT3R6J2_9HYPH|nr:gamma-glutamylcyclotransferase [Roseibium sp. DSM 29163]MCX2724890.1 gamma-glutamylcyclotransferase [Roseibium sp. DSM 29163]
MSDFWVFGYGSLMWNPGFDHLRAEPALLRGGHRALCVYSWVHRGTEQRPGLVFGLDNGGACRGMAYQVHTDTWPQTLDYLRAREQTTMVYKEHWRNVVLESGDRVRALVYMVDHRHPQYAGALPLEKQLDIVIGAVGKSGANPEYVINTAAHLEEMGIADRGIAWLADQLKGLAIS